MRAIVYHNPWDIRIEDREEPTISSPDEVIVAIRATGICGTDLSIVSGEYTARPRVIIGHESAGVIVETGAGAGKWKAGDRVIIDPTYFCGECSHCRKGLRNHCLEKATTEAGVSIDGTFTKYFKTTSRFIYPLNEEIPFEQGAMAEPLSCVLTAVKKLAVTPFMRTAILGGGPIGLLFYTALAQHGIKNGIIYEASENRIKLIEEHNVLADNWTLEPEFIPQKNQFDLIIDTTGSLLEKSMQAIADGGKISMMGLRNNQQTINPREIADRSISIIGSIDSQDTFKHAVDLINSGSLGLEKIITNQYSLNDFGIALKHLGCNLETQRRSNDISSLKSIIQL